MISGDNIGIIASQVVNDTDGTPLTANQTVNVNLKDLSASGATDITASSITLNWDNTNKCFYILDSDLSSSLQEGRSYVGQIADSGVGNMRTIPIYIEIDTVNVELNTQGKADVNAELVDVLKTDTIAELSAGAPATTPTFEEAIMFLYMALRNEAVSTDSQTQVKNDAGTAIAQATITESSSQVTRSKFAAP